MGSRELDTIVATAALQVPATYEIVDYVFNSGNHIRSTARVHLKKDDEDLEYVGMGDGPIDAAFAAGWRRCKLYFMVGLPTETDDDIKGIASLAQRAYDRAKAAVPPEQRGSVRMSVSCAVFVPKAQTPFQWDGQISPEETLRRVGLLKRSVKYKAVDVHYHDPATSFVEAVMSRGGREVADWVEAAWRRGARFDAWTELFNEEAWTGAAEELGLDPAAIAQAEFPTDYVLPWAHITAAVSPKFLARERERAAAGITTPDCTFENCSACGTSYCVMGKSDKFPVVYGILS